MGRIHGLLCGSVGQVGEQTRPTFNPDVTVVMVNVIALLYNIMLNSVVKLQTCICCMDVVKCHDIYYTHCM